jgi:alanine racemase
MGRWAWIEIDEGAIEHNVALLRRAVAPAPVWAVVKANGYGHSAVVAANAALRAGAVGLCVALVQEGTELRSAGVTAPILVLSEQPPEELPAAIAAGLELTVYRRVYVAEIAAAATASAAATPVRVHLKVDTGMRRVGADTAAAVELADAIASSAATTLAGVFTHLAVADEPADPFSHLQLVRFDAVLAALRAAGHVPPVVHAANSAGALAHPLARRDLVRAGIAIYGIAPGPGVAGLSVGLRPALSLHARVSFVKRVAAGERISYGLRHTFTSATTVATLPLGYADGVPRRLFAAGGEVLLGGRRRPIVGVVTMDQLMIDCGDDDVAIGDHAVLIGSQGDETITATDWANALGTIGYEIVCGLTARLERRLATG